MDPIEAPSPLREYLEEVSSSSVVRSKVQLTADELAPLRAEVERCAPVRGSLEPLRQCGMLGPVFDRLAARRRLVGSPRVVCPAPDQGSTYQW